ncbi:helix-turn-helix transcriptional regulator [Bacillaceae bacterium Marseille-Q3522]|nr:helix-turn-helix transcriptional regulator [Bacillaceae bacterium Marseille-Q3522]
MRKVEIQINEILKKYDLSLNQLSLLADVRRATLSELANGKRQRIQLEHIEKIANALEIDDINEIITIRVLKDD